VLFQICVSLFFIKLTSAIFINSAFEMAGGGLLTKAQRIWCYVHRAVDTKVSVFLSPAARPPRNWLRFQVFRIVTHPFFESGVTIAILLNLVSMLDRSYTDSPVKVNVVDLIDSVFLLLYYIEMFMRLIAIGPKSFVNDPMNIFDLFVNIMSAIDFFSAGQNAAQGFQILRAVRVLRLFKILNRFRRMRLLVLSIVTSIPYFLAAICITIAFLILCAVVMSGYFHSIKYGRALSPTQNFRGFLPSFTTMFIAFFSGEWANLLPDLSVSYPYCTLPSDETNGVTDCGNEFYWLFFLIFQWVCMFFITPLFLGMIACVVLQLNDVDRSTAIIPSSGDNEDEPCLIPESDYHAFFKAWELVDPGHLGLVRGWRIKAVVCHLVNRKIADFAPRGTKEWNERLDFIVLQSVLATNNVKYLKSSSKVKSEKDVLCGFATQYVHIREVLLQMVMMVQHKCHIDSPLMQYAPWLRNATDIVSSIASQEVRSVLTDLGDRVEQKGIVLFTPSPGQGTKNVYEIIAAHIAAAGDPEDQWLNMKNYAAQAKTHRSDVSAASEVQEFQEVEDIDHEEDARRKTAHLAGIDAYAAMLADFEDDCDDADGRGVDWDALFPDEDFVDELSDALPFSATCEVDQEMQEMQDASHALGGDSNTFENPFLAADKSMSAEALAEHQPDAASGGFNPLDLCAGSRVEICSSNRSSGAVFESDAADPTAAGVSGAAQRDSGGSKSSVRATSVDNKSSALHGDSEVDLFSLPSIFRRYCTFCSGSGVSIPISFFLTVVGSGSVRLSSPNPLGSGASTRSSAATGLGRWCDAPIDQFSPFHDVFRRFEEQESYLPFIRRSALQCHLHSPSLLTTLLVRSSLLHLGIPSHRTM
jgi:hypothetical protein